MKKPKEKKNQIPPGLNNNPPPQKKKNIHNSAHFSGQRKVF